MASRRPHKGKHARSAQGSASKRASSGAHRPHREGARAEAQEGVQGETMSNRRPYRGGWQPNGYHHQPKPWLPYVSLALSLVIALSGWGVLLGRSDQRLVTVEAEAKAGTQTRLTRIEQDVQDLKRDVRDFGQFAVKLGVMESELKSLNAGVGRLEQALRDSRRDEPTKR